MGMLSKILKEYGGFTAVSTYVDSATLHKYCDSLYLQFCNLFNDATYMQNVEWKLRHYHAAKKIALGALFYTQSRYLIKHNVKNICYYSLYYSLFNAISSNLLMLPQLKLKNVVQPSHGDVFKYADNFIVRLNVYKSNGLDLLNQLRMMRELYSYHLPLGGTYSRYNQELDIDSLVEGVTNFLPVAFQFSNLVSYLSHLAWKKKGSSVVDEYEKHRDEVDYIFSVLITHDDHLGNYCLMDDADYDRQGYFLRDADAPLPINWFISDKVCEDLEAGWDEADANAFDIYDVVSYLADVINA